MECGKEIQIFFFIKIPPPQKKVTRTTDIKHSVKIEQPNHRKYKLKLLMSSLLSKLICKDNWTAK